MVSMVPLVLKGLMMASSAYDDGRTDNGRLQGRSRWGRAPRNITQLRRMQADYESSSLTNCEQEEGPAGEGFG